MIGQWFYLLFGLLFFTANGHLALISLLVDSYRALPIGAPLPDPHAFFSIAPTFLLTVLRGALSLAIPLTVAMLAVNLAFGVLARAAPALNPIQLGLPVSLLLGLFLLALLAGEMGRRCSDCSTPPSRLRTRSHTDPVITNCRLKSPVCALE